jgi:ABC-type nickel/cobalt efflux system permease component RcnA/Tol biopolymer transport system component
MKIKIIFLLFALSLFPTQTVSAHPADLYAHDIRLTISPTDLQIEWQIKTGPLLVNVIWNQLDTDQNKIISQKEKDVWVNNHIHLLIATLEDKPLALTLESAQLPTDFNKFQAGEETILFTLSTRWDKTESNAQQLVLQNNFEKEKSINWFYLTATQDTAFLFPEQKSHILTIDIIKDKNLMPAESQLISSWDTGTPALPLGQQKDVVTETAEELVPELQKRSPQEILLDLVRNEENSFLFYIAALFIAAALGALHALTPGHGKTVVAAYLVGSRGTSFHAIVLGTVVTLTHTGSVFLLGMFTLAASQYILPTTIIPFLEILSGALIISLGFYLLWQRIKVGQAFSLTKQNNKRNFSLTPTSNKKISNNIKIQSTNLHHHGDGKYHSHDVPETITWRSLIALGIGGGLVPCPDAIAILLVAVAINKIFLGLTLILSFSLGLAVVLIVVGLLMVNSRRLFDRLGFLDRFATSLPVVSALIVLILGFGLTWGAVLRAKENVAWTVPTRTPALSDVEMSINEAGILYLVENQNQVKELFIYQNKTSNLISDENVVEFAISPNQNDVAYVIQNSNIENQIWVLDLESMQNKKISDCANATCAGLVWSPDGNKIVYEKIDGAGTGFSSLWWVDINTSEDKSIFQESQLPSGNARWSPNGEWLSYATPEGIRLYNLENTETRLIENILGSAVMWSPNSKTILLRDVVIRHDQFVTQLFLYEIESQKIFNLNPNDSVENILAAWSPNGELIAVIRRDLSIPRGDQIWLMNADGSDAKMLTDDLDVLHASLNWSPDGKYLLYETYALDVFPFESELQILEIESLEIQELGIKGFNPMWMWK